MAHFHKHHFYWDTLYYYHMSFDQAHISYTAINQETEELSDWVLTICNCVSQVKLECQRTSHTAAARDLRLREKFQFREYDSPLGTTGPDRASQKKKKKKKMGKHWNPVP